MAECLCGSGLDFEECCGPIIGGVAAPTAEALMRSRFSAFAKGELDHIENTHSTAVRDEFNRSAAESTANTVQWISLEILDTVDGGEKDEKGVVEFTARFKKDGELLLHHERSDFHREDGKWVYVDGQMNPKSKPIRVEKVGRNEPCPCGSGKKYKKCCGA
jgi:SEC-C motif domain protein